MKSSVPLGLSLALLAGVLSGCGLNKAAAPGQTTGTEQAQVSDAMATTPGIVDDGVFGGSDQTSANATTGGAPTSSLIHPLRYWRRITRVVPSFEFAFSDSDSTGHPTTALVTIHKNFSGWFNIMTGDSASEITPADSSVHVVHKPLEDNWTRRVLLKREASPDSAREHAGWRVAAWSGVNVLSANQNEEMPTRIVSLRVQTANFDTTITDPLALIPREHMPEFDPASDVTFTVTTLRSNDVVVLVARDHRFKLTNNGDNTYTGVWRAPDVYEIRHVGVNALSNGTLFDDTAPYSSQAWLWHYRLRGATVASQ